jgi:hypothetical protein
MLILLAASSVDAERSFSGGRLQVNHLQHNTSTQTFKACVAVSSWAGTPLLPDETSIDIIQKSMHAPKPKEAELSDSKGKGKAREISPELEVLDNEPSGSCGSRVSTKRSYNEIIGSDEE